MDFPNHRRIVEIISDLYTMTWKIATHRSLGWVNLLLNAMYTFKTGCDRLLTLLTETRAVRRAS
jgi:hypothetical protein